jgi:alpha-glucoside transport system permease protein
VFSSKKVYLTPWLYLAPTLVILLVYLVYPVFNTIYLSLLSKNSTEFVGLANYAFAFTNPDMVVSFRNNLLWLVMATLATVTLGLIIAVLTDRVPYESLAKSAIFLPMAISFVAAGVIWKFVYAFRPAGQEQIGLLNAALSLNPNWQPVAWLVNENTNNLALIVVYVWIWTGFCMVILSAALKGIPTEILEAARVDGANEFQVFWRIILPMISPTVAVVATTMVINILKVFDIVYVMTNGNFNTDVIANQMYRQMFNFNHFGRASAIAIILLVAIVPVMLFNIRRFQQEERRR